MTNDTSYTYYSPAIARPQEGVEHDLVRRVESWLAGFDEVIADNMHIPPAQIPGATTCNLMRELLTAYLQALNNHELKGK